MTFLAGTYARLRPLWRLILLVGLASCESSIRVAEPPPPDTTGGGTVQRATLTITVALEGEAAQVGQALEMGSHRLAGARVTVRRLGDAETFTATTDAAGTARFERLLPGTFDVALVRLLDASETQRIGAQLGPGFADVNAFGGGGFADVQAPSSSVTFQALAGRRGSLVISEVYEATPFSPTGSYRRGRYLEIYNNGDEVVYLDGMLLVNGIGLLYQQPDYSCTELEKWLLDPDGIWSEWHVRFPGTGRDHPIVPGSAVVVATDAIDHREFWPGPGAFDLSRAGFEGVGQNDVDNPSVPNLIDIGTRRWEIVLGGGWYPPTPGALALVAPVDTTGLPIDNIPYFKYTRYRRIPTSKLLDLVTLLHKPEIERLIGQHCPRIIDASLDRNPARIADQYEVSSIARKLLARLPDGRPILLRTRTSASDFERRAGTPGTVP